MVHDCGQLLAAVLLLNQTNRELQFRVVKVAHLLGHAPVFGSGLDSLLELILLLENAVGEVRVL